MLFDDLPERLRERFLDDGGGKLDYWDWYVEESGPPATKDEWSGVVAIYHEAGRHGTQWLGTGVDGWVERARAGDTSLPSPYPRAPEQFYRLLNEVDVGASEVAVVGSISPWIEAILLSRGAVVTTVDFNPVRCDHPALRSLSRGEFLERVARFDAVFSYSSIEHDGLGRYGDPIDPDGDLCAMSEIRTVLRSGGTLYLAVPMHHHDVLRFNADRLYGPVRFKRLLEGWRVVGQTPDPIDGVLRGLEDYWRTWRLAHGPGQSGPLFTSPDDPGVRHERAEHPVWWLEARP